MSFAGEVVKVGSSAMYTAEISCDAAAFTA
jgi:hypothetical protein